MSKVQKKLVSETANTLLLNEIIQYYYSSKHKNAYQIVEKIGFQVGQRLTIKLTSEYKCRFSDNLDMIKFLCKEFWIEVYKKQIDGLKTNHRGTYVLTDMNFKSLSVMSGSSKEETVLQSEKYVVFPCGLIRGSLSALGINTVVTCSVKNYPMCIFKIKEIKK